jgi:hypothetical protein
MQSSNIIQRSTLQSSSASTECYKVWTSATDPVLIRYNLRSIDRVFDYLVKTIEVANGLRCCVGAHRDDLPGALREVFAQLAAFTVSCPIGTWSGFGLSSLCCSSNWLILV